MSTLSVPKTLIQHLIRWIIGTNQFDAKPARLCKALWTPKFRRNWCRRADENKDQPSQSTQEKIGPYELQDFNLYYITRYGFRPSKVAFLAHQAWSDKTRGAFPDSLPQNKHHEYDLATIKKWLGTFVYRFFKISQFKRSCVPNGPKVGSGGSLSPRGDWRAPSDSEADVWIDELKENVPDE